MKILTKFILFIASFVITMVVRGESVYYHFTDSLPSGIVVNGVPSSIVDGALKIDIDESSQAWKAKMLVTVNRDIYENPVMDIRYKIGDPVDGSAGLAVTLKIDDLYTRNGYSGTWRLYPSVNLSVGEWQNLEVDLTPLINSWESTNSQEHGNVQEIMIFIGNTNGPFVASELYIDYIQMGDVLKVRGAELNPNDLSEILVDLGVPVTSLVDPADFNVQVNGISEVIDSAFIHGESNLIVKLQAPIEMPRYRNSGIPLPSMVLSYNGNSTIEDTTGVVLKPFTETISFSAYTKSLYKYWGEYKFTDIPFKSPWSESDTVVDSWDWSLPEFVTPDSMAYVWYKNRPNMDFSSKNLNSVYVQWNDLEPVQGEYNFDMLRENIRDAAVGYDGVTLRLLAAVWDWVSSIPGGEVPQWLADRNSAPRWMEDLDIAKIPMGDEGVYAVNMDIMDPEYHALYKKFIKALGESGIPDMPELKIVNVCYRSRSAGEEFTKYDPANNAIEAQYSAAIIEQRTKERLDIWAEAFGENVRKLLYVGSGDAAYVSYGGELGIGSRQGFVEHYNGFVVAPQFGFTINEETRYSEVDETNLFIANNLAFGDENEEYDNEERFGWKESFPYRYYASTFRMLQQRRNYVMHGPVTLNPELTWYLGLGLSRKVDNTPDAWAMLSEYYLRSGTLKNMERWLYQRDMPGYVTTPAMEVPIPNETWYRDASKPYNHTARKGKKIGFYVDDRLFPSGEQSMAIKVSFYDGVTGSLKLVYENIEGVQETSVVSNGTDQVRTATFFINARLDVTTFDHDFDFLLESEEEVPVFFVRVIKTETDYDIGVITPDVAVTNVTINDCPGHDLQPGDKYQLSAIIEPDNATDKRYTWKTSDTLIANIDENGLVTALSAGSAIIEATAVDGELTDQCTITVSLASSVIDNYSGKSAAVKVYPNPVSEKLFFEFSESGCEKKIEIYSINGQLLISKSTFNSSLELDVKSFRSEGFIIIKVISGDRTDLVRILIEK